VKQCNKCKEVKVLAEFTLKKHIKSGFGARCKACTNKMCNTWNGNNRDRVNTLQRKRYKDDNGEGQKNSDLIMRYGITLEQYNQMFKDQEGKCGICLRERSQFSKRFDVDHSHTTGKVRGLLCRACNLAFGYLNENLKVITRMAEYAEKHQIAIVEIDQEYKKS